MQTPRMTGTTDPQQTKAQEHRQALLINAARAMGGAGQPHAHQLRPCDLVHVQLSLGSHPRDIDQVEQCAMFQGVAPGFVHSNIGES